MPLSMMALVAVLLATAVAGGLSALAARSSRRGDLGSAAPWWGAFAVGLADLIAQIGVATPAFPPSDVSDRIPIVALAAASVAAILSGRRGVWWARLIGYTGLASLVYLVMLGPVLGAGEYSEETIGQLATIAVASLLAMLNVGWLDAASKRSELWVGLTVLSGGAGVVLLLANSAVLFLLAGTLALVMGVSLAGSWGRAVGGGVPVAAAVLTALVVEGSVYAFLPRSSGLLLAGAPALLWVLRIGRLSRLGPKTRGILAGGLILIPLAIAIYLVYASHTDDGYGI